MVRNIYEELKSILNCIKCSWKYIYIYKDTKDFTDLHICTIFIWFILLIKMVFYLTYTLEYKYKYV